MGGGSTIVDGSRYLKRLLKGTRKACSSLESADNASAACACNGPLQSMVSSGTGSGAGSANSVTHSTAALGVIALILLSKPSAPGGWRRPIPLLLSAPLGGLYLILCIIAIFARRWMGNPR